MRTVFYAVVIATFLAAASRAQDAAPPNDHFSAQYEHRPHAPIDTRYYPRRSIERGERGVVLLCCRPNADRTLSCDIGFEAPEGRGFGQAGRRMIEEQSQMTAQSFADYTALGTRPALPVTTRFASEGQETLDVRGDTWGVCNLNPPAN